MVDADCCPAIDDQGMSIDAWCEGFFCRNDENPWGCEPGIQNCPDGEKCTAFVRTPGYCCVDTTTCVPVIGDKQFGEPCTRDAGDGMCGPGNDDCAAGLFCMAETSGDGGDGVCLAFCDFNNPNACDEKGLPDAECPVFGDGVLSLCQLACDPLAQGCPSSQGCYVFGDDQITCAPPNPDVGKGKDGDDCHAYHSCDAGLLCADGQVQEGCNDDRCCTPFCECDPDMPNGVDAQECTGNERCICLFDQNPPLGHEDVGICQLPP
jgi:hypothetical protein